MIRVLFVLVAATVSIPAHADVTLAVTPGTDIYGAVDAAIAANSGKVIKLTPAGDYQLSQPLVFGTGKGGLAGDGPGLTTVTYTGAGANSNCAIQFSSTGAQIDNNSIRNISIFAPGAATEGCGIMLRNTLNFRLENVEVALFPVLIKVEGGSNIFLSRWKGYSAFATLKAGSRYLKIGRDGSQVTNGVFITNASLAANSLDVATVEVGIELNAVDGFYMSGPNYIGEAATLFDIHPDSAGAFVANVAISGALFDGNFRKSGLAQSNTGLRVRGVTNAAVKKVAITGNVFSDFQQDGVQIALAQASGIVISGNVFQGGRRTCVDLAASTQVSILGNTFESCGNSKASGAGAITYNDRNNVVTIVGNTFVGSAPTFDISSPSLPNHIQQGLNSTDKARTVPTINQ